MQNFKFLSIRNKFFYAMFLSSGLIITIVCIVTNIVFVNSFIDEQKSSSCKELEYISKQLEFFITSTENYSRAIITAPVVQETAHKYKQNQNIYTDTSFIQVKDELNHIIQSTPYIHSVSLYGFNGDFLTSTFYGNSADNILTRGTFPEKKWFSTLKPLKTDAHTFVNTFSCIRPFYSYSTGEHLGYLEIAILESSIAQVYANSISEHDQIFITDTQGYIRSTTSPLTIGEPYPLFESISNLDVPFSYTHHGDTILFTRYFPMLDWYIINEVSTESFFNPIYSILWICISIGLLCIMLYVPLARLLSRTITSPLQKLIAHTQKIKEGRWIPLQDVEGDEDVTSLLKAFNSMVESQEKMKNKLLYTQRAKDKLALDLLQEQINPHFLYNTLDNICSLAEIGESDTLIHVVMNLSKFYRRALSNGKVFITIKEELELTEAYLHILQIRYFNKFDFNITCKSELLGYNCLKLLLQPIVENSIYHGVKELSYKGLLKIHVFEENGAILLTVRDNGIGIDEVKIHELFCNQANHFGIKNIHQRIQLHYGQDYGLTIANHPDGGCITTIRIAKKGGTIHETKCSNSR